MRHAASTISVFVILLAGLLFSGCRDYAFDPDGSESGMQNGLPVAFSGVPFELTFGQRVALDGTGLDVEFSNVSEDSRCASDVDCEQAGRAGIVLTVTDSQNVRYQVIAHIPGLVATPYTVNDLIQFYDFRFQLLQVNPYPLDGVSRDVSDYSVLLLFDPL